MRKQWLVTVAMICSLTALQAQTTDKEARLKKSAPDLEQQLQEVVVTGTGTQHLLKDAPVQTEVISRKMLDSYGGKSLEDILNGLTASFAFSEGDMGSQMQLGGLGNSYILILIDGKRIHGDVGGENDLGLIDPQNIEKIEIVKGAQSALYGSDAMAGVINIITKKHTQKGLYVDNNTQYGTHNDLRQHNTLALNYGKWSSQTNFQLQRNDGWQNTAEEYAEAMVLTDSKNKTVNKFRNWQIAERLTFQPTKKIELYADGTYYKKDIMRPRDGKHASCDVYTYDLHYNNASASMGGKWKLGGKGSLQDYVTLDVDWNMHAYYYKYTARHYDYVLLEGEEYGDQNGEWFSVAMYPGQRKLQSNQQRVMGQLKGIFHLPYNNTINAGAEYRYDHLKAPERTATGTASDWTAAVYVQDEFNKLSWLNITAGLRLVDNQNFGFRLTPKISAMASWGDWRFRLGWSQGFKTPTVKELYYRYLHIMGSSTFFNMGNTKLDPQTSNYWSANIEYRGDKLTASITGYINKLDNMIALVNVPVGEIPAGVTTAYMGDGSNNVQARMYKNMDDARTCGVDVTLAYKFTKELSMTAAYSYLDTEAHLYDADNEAIFFGMPLLDKPEVDVKEVAKQLNALYASEASDGVVAFMGHGNPDKYDTFKANVRYEQLEEELQKLNPKYFVGTVDMDGNFKQDVMARMKEKGYNTGKVYLHALMSIAGDHAHNDMAGEGEEYWSHPNNPEHEENSWYEFFNHANYTPVVPVTNKHPLGLLELEGVRNVWINHTKNAEFFEDAYHSMYPEE